MNIPVLVDLTSADVTKPIENMADRLSAAGQTVVLGMCAIFAVLAILWLVLAIVGKFFTAPAPKKEEEKKEAPVQTETAPAPVEAPAPVSNDEEIVAAITAAISLMLDKPQTAFRVVSFRQTSREAFRRNNINRN
ncbi:MAG: OadG family protein [Clostridia bacterium]|nr:OadG family protein [Clostridia bacterium]